MAKKNYPVGFVGPYDDVPIAPPPVEMYEAGTGAVRSTDLKKERWDLLSGYAFRMLKLEIGLIVPGGETPEELVEESIDYMYRFLGGDMEMDTDRVSLLLRGWAWLAAGIEAEEGTPFIQRDRYPLALMRRTAMACREGCEKYGEENWHNGFRLKVLCNHALKHMVRWSNGVVEDDELGHASWGFMAAVHMLRYRPDQCDLLLGPDYSITPELRDYHKAHLSRKQVGGASVHPIYGRPTRVESDHGRPRPDADETWVEYEDGTRAYFPAGERGPRCPGT